MKLAWATAVLLLGSQGVTSLSIPFTSQSDLIERDPDSALTNAQFVDLEKRRGGGGGGGGGRSGGGSSSGSSSSSSGGSSGGRSGSSSSGSSGGGRSGSSSSSSSSTNRGGTSSGGSGVSPSYGGGRYYAGGARTPYASGTRSPLGLTPFLLPVAALAIFPGIWLFGAYAYPYTHPYYYNDNNNRNQSLPVTCLCEQYQECGCDDTNNSTYYESLFNGTQPRNTSNVQVVNVNGTKTIVINGTLPNGTTADDGTSSSTSSSTSGAALGPLVTLVNASGYWVMVAVVVATVWSI